MRCFEIDEKVKLITLKAPFKEVMVGEEETGSFFKLPLHPSFSTAVRQSVLGLVQKYEPDGMTMPDNIQLEEVRLDRRNGLVLTKKGPTPSGEWDRQALVLVRTPAGPNGTVAIASEKYHIEVCDNVPKMSFDEPFPPEGIEVLGTGKSKGYGDDQVTETLLVMEPKSGFRIFRTGELEGAPDVLHVRWDWFKSEQGRRRLDLRVFYER